MSSRFDRVSSLFWLLAVGGSVGAHGCGGPTGPLLRADPLYHPGMSAEWDSARTPDRLQAEFVTYQIDRHHDPNAGEVLRWRFEPRSERFGDMFLRKSGTGEFGGVRLRVSNRGPGVQLAVKLADAHGAEWTVDPVRLDTPEWRDVQWTQAQFRVASWSQDADGQFDLPFRYMAVIASDVSAGHVYELWIKEVAILHELAYVPLARIQVAPKVRAGQAVPVTLHYGGSPPTSPWCVDLTREGRQLFRLKLGRVESGRSTGVPISPYLPGGAYRLELRLGDVPVVAHPSGEPVTASISVEQRKADADATVAQVCPFDGVPTLHLNGRPDSCMVYMTYHPSARYFAQFGRAGVRLYSFSSTPSESNYGLAPTAWVAPDRFDFSHLDDRALMVLNNVPDACFFPRIYLFSPSWWDERHPMDLVTYDPGDGRPQPFARDGKKRTPSWASQAWRQDTARAIRRYIEHIERSGYADRVIGYHLASGTTEEWMMWGANENQWVDYSPVNQAAFREWLTRRYGSDDALRQAWRDDKVTLLTAGIPTKEARARTQYGILRAPQVEQNVIDFTLYNSDLVADTIAYFARVVKQATRGKKLVGVFYGYLLQLMEQRQQNAGHLSLKKVLENPDIDFLTSPTSYAFRTPGSGYSHFMSLTDSVKLHGKLWINENDIRTWLVSGKTGQWGRTDTYEETLKQQQRELASVLGQGCGQWWFDMGGGWYDDTRLMGEITKMRQIADKTLGRPRGPVAEVAVVVDDKSLAYMQPGNPLSSPLLLGVLPHLARTGAPVAYYALSDLTKAPRHKMYVFLNAFAPDEEDRKAIGGLKGEGRVLVFFWAAGLYRNGRLDPEGLSDLIGMKVTTSTRRRALSGHFVEGADLTKDLVGQSFGVGVSAAPSFAVDDPNATVLARGDHGEALLAAREHGTWTAVYSAAPLHSREVFRRLARKGRVHCYIDTPDVVYATQSLLGIACDRPGRRTVHLRAPAKVRELFSDTLVCDGAEEFTIDVEEHGTVLFQLDPK